MNYIILPAFSLEPNKMSTYNRVFAPNKFTKDGVYKQKLHSANKIVRSFHNFTISENAYRSLKRKINWLYYFSKAKHVKTYSGKDIFNFKIAFLTLTLPSKQQQPTAEITKHLFNQFLTEVRQRTGMKNYVWRLEFQKNKNVHYHIVTDTYLDYFLVLKIWNRILKKAGYTQAYTNKHKSLSFKGYCSLYNSDNSTDKNTMAKRYAKGCANRWEQPNTVDVKSVISNKKIANYISKYFAKSSDDSQVCNILDTPENSKSLRLWFCSRSLSKLNSVSDFCEAVEYDIFALVSQIKEVRQHLGRWARTFYYDFNKCVEFEYRWLRKILYDYGKKQGYFELE